MSTAPAVVNYLSKISVGEKVVLGRGLCDCGASELVPHPHVLVADVKAVGMGLIITAYGAYRMKDGTELGVQGSPAFRRIIDPETSLDAQYALCDDKLAGMQILRDAMGSDFPAYEFLSEECARLESELDELMEKVNNRI